MATKLQIPYDLLDGFRFPKKCVYCAQPVEVPFEGCLVLWTGPVANLVPKRLREGVYVPCCQECVRGLKHSERFLKIGSILCGLPPASLVSFALIKYYLLPYHFSRSKFEQYADVAMIMGLFCILFTVGSFLGGWITKAVLSPFLPFVRRTFLSVDVRGMLPPDMAIRVEPLEAKTNGRGAVFTFVNDVVAQECIEIVTEAKRDTQLGKWRQAESSSLEAEVGNQVAYGKLVDVVSTSSSGWLFELYLGEDQPWMRGFLAAGAPLAITEVDGKTYVLSDIAEFRRYSREGEDTVCIAILPDDLLRWQKHKRTVTRILSIRVLNTGPRRVVSMQPVNAAHQEKPYEEADGKKRLESADTIPKAITTAGASTEPIGTRLPALLQGAESLSPSEQSADTIPGELT